MGSPTAPANLTLSDGERSSSKSFIFRGLVSPKGVALELMLLFNMKRKSLWGVQFHHQILITLKCQVQVCQVSSCNTVEPRN